MSNTKGKYFPYKTFGEQLSENLEDYILKFGAIRYKPQLLDVVLACMWHAFYQSLGIRNFGI